MWGPIKLEEFKNIILQWKNSAQFTDICITFLNLSKINNNLEQNSNKCIVDSKFFC